LNESKGADGISDIED